MSAETVVQHAQELGITLTLNGDKIQMRPGSAASPDFVDELRRNKDEVLDYLRQQAKERLSQRYEQSFQGEGLIADELAELERRVEAEGFVLCHIEHLADFVAFHRDGIDLATIPTGFVPYSDRELRELFGSDKPDMPADALRLIHAAKVLGANVTGNHADTPLRKLLERLRDGHRWLCTEYARSFDESDYNADKFANGLATWDELEKTLRAVYGYKGCVYGEGEQCPEDAPVRCDACIEAGRD